MTGALERGRLQMSFHHVVVAFDGSPRSADALALALRLRDPPKGC